MYEGTSGPKVAPPRRAAVSSADTLQPASTRAMPVGPSTAAIRSRAVSSSSAPPAGASTGASPFPRTRTVASTFRFIGAFGAAFLISLFVRPLVKYLGAESEIRGFQLTMAIFAIVSVDGITTTLVLNL